MGIQNTDNNLNNHKNLIGSYTSVGINLFLLCMNKNISKNMQKHAILDMRESELG